MKKDEPEQKPKKKETLFTHNCRPRKAEFEPDEDAVLDEPLMNKTFKRTEALLISECKANPKLNVAFLIAFAADISCCGTFGDFIVYKNSCLEDIRNHNFNRVELMDEDGKNTIYYPGERDVNMVGKIIALLENTYRQEFHRRLTKTTLSKE